MSIHNLCFEQNYEKYQNFFFRIPLRKQAYSNILKILPPKAVLTSTQNLCFVQKYEKISEFLSPKHFQFLVVKFSVYLNRLVFVMGFEKKKAFQLV